MRTLRIVPGLPRQQRSVVASGNALHFQTAQQTRNQALRRRRRVSRGHLRRRDVRCPAQESRGDRRVSHNRPVHRGLRQRQQRTRLEPCQPALRIRTKSSRTFAYQCWEINVGTGKLVASKELRCCRDLNSITRSWLRIRSASGCVYGDVRPAVGPHVRSGLPLRAAAFGSSESRRLPLAQACRSTGFDAGASSVRADGVVQFGRRCPSSFLATYSYPAAIGRASWMLFVRSCRCSIPAAIYS